MQKLGDKMSTQPEKNSPAALSEAGMAQVMTGGSMSGAYQGKQIGFDNILLAELAQLDGINGHNPDTGRPVATKGGLLGQYTNRIFGGPHQLLNSVDRRFPIINAYVGNEFLRNFLLNSPILHIKPGRPQYTGNPPSMVGEFAQQTILMHGNFWQTLGLTLEKGILFRKGAQLQRRMFGFRETYIDYMSHVNYMCRTLAHYLGLVGNDNINLGTFTSNKGNGPPEFESFTTIRWQNYRLFNQYVATGGEQLGALVGAGANSFMNTITFGIWNWIRGGDTKATIAEKTALDAEGNTHQSTSEQDIKNMMEELKDFFLDRAPTVDGGKDMKEVELEFRAFADSLKIPLEDAREAAGESWRTMDSMSAIAELHDQKIKSVSFMVEPTSFSENFGNQTKQSMIQQTVSGLDGLGSEIAFITNSNTDLGPLGTAAKMLGGSMTGMAENLSSLLTPVTGGFATHLFNGALGSIKGQRMIYPEIYESSTVDLGYDFTITLSTPYGDVYNYYINVLVPLMHLMCLVCPRLVSANSTTSPYLVQAYMPGMMTVQLGIVESLSIEKNPALHHVSVQGFPLTLKCQMKIKELYNSMAISPANDPASFLFNETLNDYLTNLAGLVPSMSTLRRQRDAMSANSGEYFKRELGDDIASGALEWVENKLFTFR